MTKPMTVAVLAAASLLVVSPLPAGQTSEPELGPWEVLSKLRLPAPAVGMVVSDDKRIVLALCAEKRRRDSGAGVPGFVTVHILHGFAADSGKELFAAGMSELTPRMAMKGNRLALSDTFDKVTIMDLATGKKVGLIDPRSPNDSPPGSDKNIQPELKDFGVGGRLSDIEFTADAKVLVTCRFENTPWKTTGKGAFTSESFERLVFWDVDKGTKLGVLDCEDKLQRDGQLTLLPQHNQMLARFSDGLRLVDLSSKKWGKTMTMKDVYSSAVSSDEKLIVVTGRDQSVKVLDTESLTPTVTFKEQPINRLPRVDGSLNPTGFEFGPSAQFVDENRALRVTLNDGKTVVYRDVKTGAKIKTPASEAMKFPGGPARLIAISGDRRCAITAPMQGGEMFTVWIRELTDNKK